MYNIHVLNWLASKDICANNSKRRAQGTKRYISQLLTVQHTTNKKEGAKCHVLFLFYLFI